MSEKEQSVRRPLIVTAWAVLLGIGGAMDIANAVYAYGFTDAEYTQLNPSAFAVFRPITWVAGLAAPIGLWMMRRWAVPLYVFMQLASVALVYVVRPEWAKALPDWAMPFAIVVPVVFLISVAPYWRRMSGRFP